MGFNSFISNIAETAELHNIGKLRSRYYRTNYQKAKAVVLEYVPQLKASIRNIDDEHKEIFLQANRFHIVVTFVQITPIETSIDLKVEYYGMFGFNRPQKKIFELYEYLDKNLTFKGVGLHP